MSDKLSTALKDPHHFVFLYGTTPPRADAPPDKVDRAVTRLAARTAPLDLDGIVVYDVQDESERTSQPRPFPFLPTLETRDFSRTLQNATGKDVICYKSVARASAADWKTWLDGACDEYGLRCLSLVGRAASSQELGGIPLVSAMREAARHRCGFTLGGVVIPERHRLGHSESERLLSKAANGCEYFISQAVYSPEAAIKLIRDYARACHVKETTPKRIVLTFTPCGGERTMGFMKWLGIAIPPEIEQTILSSLTPLTESLRVCASAFHTFGTLREIQGFRWVSMSKVCPIKEMRLKHRLSFAPSCVAVPAEIKRPG